MKTLLLLLPHWVFGLGDYYSGPTPTATNVSDIVENLLTNRSRGYNSKVRPGADTDDQLTVQVNLYVTEIYRISEADMEFSMTFYLRQKWLDQRLAYYPAYNKTITLNYNQFSKVWTPDLFIRNLKAGHLHDITVPNRLIRLYPNGTLLFSQRLSVTLACDMFLERYPMDNQTCHINLGSYAYTLEDMLLVWDMSASTPVVVNPKISFPKFDFNGVSQRVCSAEYATTGAYPCIEAYFHLERRLKSYILYIYLPSLMVVVLSWVSFWIDLYAVPARISLGILTILTITTQSVGVNRNLPSVSFTKAIDVWMVSCLVFVFAAFIEYSIVNVLARKPKPPKGSAHSRHDSYRELQIVHPSKEGDLIPLNQSNNGAQEGETEIRHRSVSSPTTIPSSPTSCCSHRMDKNSHHQGAGRRSKRSTALTVDIISRVLFPLLFMIFNALYWPYYFWHYTF